VHQRYRQTDGRAMAYSERERKFTSAKNSAIAEEPLDAVYVS